MTRPGFRKGRSGGGQPASTGQSAGGFVSGTMFSQAQIMHLMKSEFARSRRHKLQLSCLLLQVERLPQLVDLHGAELRQVVQQALLQLVQEKTRGADLLGMFNEDRYLLVLPHTRLDDARQLAARLRALFAELEIRVDGKALALELAIGLAACEEQQTMFFDSMIAQAEAALAYALQKGGDRIATFGEARLLADPTRPPVGDGPESAT